MAENRHLDVFLESFDPGKASLNGACERNGSSVDRNTTFFNIDDLMKQKILKNAKRKLHRRKAIVRNAAVACILLVLLSSFIPNTPAYALRQAILSYIPGIGVVESTDETGIVTGVLAEPVRIADGEKFVEIRSAFLRGNVLTISGLTNVGTIDTKNFDTVKDYKEFFSGETTPGIYLVQDQERIKAGHQLWAGPSYESNVYKVSVYFYLNQDTPARNYLIEMDGLDKPIEITLSTVKAGMIPEEIGNAAVVEDVMVFAHTIREKDIVEVLINVIAPNDYKHPGCYLFDHEKDLFESGVYLIDQSGTRYEPDDELRKSRDSEMNTFYFHVPEEKTGLKLVVPQILFQREYQEDNIKITMPKKNKETQINKTVQLGSHSISLEKATLVPAGSDILPDEFKTTDCLMLNASATTETGSRESVLRIVPNIQVMDSPFHFVQVSQAVNAEFWDPKLHSGYSLVQFEDIEKTKKILINFTAEFSMAGPWEIQLDED